MKPGTYVRTPETRAKNGMAMKGRRHTKKARAKISAALKGRKLGTPSQAHRDALSAAAKGRSVWNKGKVGVYSSETLERQSAAKTTHGHAARGIISSTYRTWSSMLVRTTNPKHIGWKYYGARGISVCERWLAFANFLADMGERPDGKTLDRIDTDGNYTPDNCRWATRSEQRKNQRRSRS